MSNKNIKYLVLHFFLTIIVQGQSQDCNLTIRGQVLDEGTQEPLSFVNVLIQETATGTITEDDGSFLLEDICAGEYHIIFSHIGCEGDKIHLDLESDTIITIELSHSPTSLSTVVVEGKKESLISQPNLSVTRKTIEDNPDKNLSAILENEAGVHLIKNGNGISKPVVQGLYGNRLIILNNGIVQSGQQWGNDHSPEIDPFAADKIIVLKGVSAIEYGGGNLGGVILVEPKRIDREHHLHGQINYSYDTNGRGHSINTRLGKYSPSLAWRINGTFKKYGDQRTPDYFLNNTGTQEINFAIQLEKTWSERLYFDFYASTFNTQLGVLRGSHIGNLTDLESALSLDVPFFTEPDFSYDLDAPRQNVSHHLIKAKVKYLISDHQVLDIIIAGQINDRQEYDVRRGGRTDRPAMSLLQLSLNSEIKYTYNFDEDWTLKLGNQTIATDNENIPETGILPLIPDYESWRSGLFTTLTRRKEKVRYNVGLRYDYEYQNVPTISGDLPRRIIRYKNNFLNVSGLLSAEFDLGKSHTIGINSGYATRNPAINELYSSGLHQGVSGIEEGDTRLNTERVLKNSLEYKWLPNTDFSISALFYHQHFKDYIFLNPQDEFRLTIRGAFPVFRYEQTDANIYGIDLASQFTVGRVIFGVLRYSYIKGQDTTNDLPLVFIPPNSFYGSLTYRLNKSLPLSDNINIAETEIELNNRLVWEQTNIVAGQDFAPPPPTYNLLGFKVSANLITPKHKIRCFIKGENILNVKYRDYLNRQRYFADDIGISITGGVNFKF